MARLASRDGDDCPKDDCDNSLHHRDHGAPSRADVEPAGPVEELICPIHGIMESV